MQKGTKMSNCLSVSNVKRCTLLLSVGIWHDYMICQDMKYLWNLVRLWFLLSDFFSIDSSLQLFEETSDPNEMNIQKSYDVFGNPIIKWKTIMTILKKARWRYDFIWPIEMSNSQFNSICYTCKLIDFLEWIMIQLYGDGLFSVQPAES